MNRVEFWRRSAVRVKVRVGPSKVLAVVAGKIEMVKRVVGRRVDESFEEMARDHVSIVNQDRPELDKNEQPDVEVSVEREHVDKDADCQCGLNTTAVSTHWYGRDWAYPSTGWNASADQGVATDISKCNNFDVVHDLLIHLWWGL